MSDPTTTLTTEQLAESAQSCLWGLVTAALRTRGRDEALASLDAIEGGSAHVSFFIDLTGAGALIVGTLNQAGGMVPLVFASVDNGSAVDPSRLN